MIECLCSHSDMLETTFVSGSVGMFCVDDRESRGDATTVRFSFDGVVRRLVTFYSPADSFT